MTKRLWELLSLHWNNEISDEEKAELDELLLQHPGDWLRSGMLNQLSFSRKPAEDEDEATARLMDKVTQAITAEPPAAVPPRRKWPVLKMLMGFLFMLGCAGALWGYLYGGKQHGYKIVSTDAGMRTKIRLPDGSTIWLNAGSTLRYPAKMDKHQREVYLSGEGFFDVKHAANRPFIIHAATMDIRVLGTSFNVRSYKEEDFEETAVISGAVEVILKEGQQRLKVAPNEKVIVRTGAAPSGRNIGVAREQTNNMAVERQPLSPISTADSTHVLETAWINNQLIFRNETLQSLALRLERWYGVKIIIRDSELAGLRFSGRADNVSVEKLLNILQEIQPFKYSIQDDIITIN
ncbi:FecR family protein [Chitinophaga polysaccharea]|uniref:FecR family protein n=1 Tax=Chitinophaga polysaccharea TaxID=1293035 RepID=A0A561PTE7_9BACT|nr:FecR domain-containing protein [Chitinophaga polysaccharea]TWF41391.1 FecR family protein [Chitinophaga polysaccharea]